jgi:hypothetical protein
MQFHTNATSCNSDSSSTSRGHSSARVALWWRLLRICLTPRRSFLCFALVGCFHFAACGDADEPGDFLAHCEADADCEQHLLCIGSTCTDYCTDARMCQVRASFAPFNPTCFEDVTFGYCGVPCKDGDCPDGLTCDDYGRCYR